MARFPIRKWGASNVIIDMVNSIVLPGALILIRAVLFCDLGVGVEWDSNFKRLISLYKLIGLWGLGTHFWRKLHSFRPGSKCVCFFLYVLSEPQLDEKTSRAGLKHTFRFAKIADIESLLVDPNARIFQRDLDSYREGNRCLLQMDGSELVGYTWIANSQLVDIAFGQYYNLPDDMAYNYNGFTTKKYRGHSFQALRHVKALELLKNEGKTRIFAYVHNMNYRSLKGIPKSGYQKIGSIKFILSKDRIRTQLDVEKNCWAEFTRIGPKQYS